MPACVECGYPAQELVVIESKNKALKRCANCSQPCDRFLEYDVVQLSLCLILMVKEAFAHVLFNIPNLAQKLLLVVILSVALESYVVLVTTEYASFKRQHRDVVIVRGSPSSNTLSPIEVGMLADGALQTRSTAVQQLIYNLTGTSDEASAAMLFGVKLLGSTLSELVASNGRYPEDTIKSVNATLQGVSRILSSDITVQLVPVFNQHKSLIQVIDFSRLPVLMSYGFAEFAFVSLCSVWVAGLFVPRQVDPLSKGKPKGTFTAFMRAACLASGAKLVYIIFLVWQIPPYLMSIGEVAAVGWTHAGFRACGLSSRSALVLVAGNILARWLVRSLTLWAPQLLMLEAMGI